MIKKIPYLHILLFLFTCLTTLVAGSLQKGVNPIETPWRIAEGLPFSVTLMLILLSHELSHYFASRFNHTEATLPYFIPSPTLIGTFGAFIKMKSPIITRKALIDIGASGPIAGFIVSVVASIIGLYYSEVITVKGTEGLILGDSLLFSGLSRLILGVTPADKDILLHPIAFAGWIGFFVTSINLLPVGQLDGGHISYAFLGESHRQLSTVLVILLAILGLFTWEGWVIWSLLLTILGLSHPPVLHWETPLDESRRNIGILSLFIFIITFTPTPFQVHL